MWVFLVNSGRKFGTMTNPCCPKTSLCAGLKPFQLGFLEQCWFKVSGNTWSRSCLLCIWEVHPGHSFGHFWFSRHKTVQQKKIFRSDRIFTASFCSLHPELSRSFHIPARACYQLAIREKIFSGDPRGWEKTFKYTCSLFSTIFLVSRARIIKLRCAPIITIDQCKASKKEGNSAYRKSLGLEAGSESWRDQQKKRMVSIQSFLDPLGHARR